MSVFSHPQLFFFPFCSFLSLPHCVLCVIRAVVVSRRVCSPCCQNAHARPLGTFRREDFPSFLHYFRVSPPGSGILNAKKEQSKRAKRVRKEFLTSTTFLFFPFSLISYLISSFYLADFLSWFHSPKSNNLQSDSMPAFTKLMSNNERKRKDNV